MHAFPLPVHPYDCFKQDNTLLTFDQHAVEGHFDC